MTDKEHQQTRLPFCRVALYFPVLLFVLVRQFYSNLLGINRDLLTVLLVGAFSVLGLAGFSQRLHRGGGQFLLVDALTLVQALVAGLGILAYAAFARISPAEGISALYYYCLAPFLIYSGFQLRRLGKATIQAVTISAALAYAFTICVAIYEVIGIHVALFQNDRWLPQKNYYGIARATGLYGTQIDYGCLSFFAFTVAYYINRGRASWLAKAVVALGVLGALASMSRVALAAIGTVILVEALVGSTLKQKFRRLIYVALMIAFLYPISQTIGMTSMLLSSDPLTEESNQGHLAYYTEMSRLLLQNYPIIGTGPGSQNGPGGGIREKVIGDLLWLGFLVDFGVLTGSVLVLCRMTLLGYLLCRAHRFRGGGPIAAITTALSLMFLLASFVDSAFAHPVTVSIFYIMAGVFVYEDSAARLGTVYHLI